MNVDSQAHRWWRDVLENAAVEGKKASWDVIARWKVAFAIDDASHEYAATVGRHLWECIDQSAIESTLPFDAAFGLTGGVSDVFVILQSSSTFVIRGRLPSVPVVVPRFESIHDVCVVGRDMSWSWVSSHESEFGPWFLRRKDSVALATLDDVGRFRTGGRRSEDEP